MATNLLRVGAELIFIWDTNDFINLFMFWTLLCIRTNGYFIIESLVKVGK